MQREFAHDIAVEVGYVGNKGTHLQASSAKNIPLPGPGKCAGAPSLPAMGRAGLQDLGRASTYHSLQAKLEKRFSSGFSFLGSYSFSKCLDAPGSEEGSAPAYYLDNLYKGRCDDDVPHNFVTSYIWELPFGKGRRILVSAPKALDFVVGGWQLQGINTLQSGVPYNVSISADLRIRGQASVRTRLRRPLSRTSELLVLHVVESGVQVAAAESGRHIRSAGSLYVWKCRKKLMRGDRLIQLDMSLIKNFAITETKRAEFRAQVFNLMNTPSFAAPNGSVNLASGGTITATRNQPRLYEFGLKFSF